MQINDALFFNLRRIQINSLVYVSNQIFIEGHLQPN